MLVSSVDLTPTLLGAAGLDPPAEMPGLDLLDAIVGGEPPLRDAIFGEAFAHDIADVDDPTASLLYRWVIEGRFKLLVHHDGALGRILEEATGVGVDHVIVPANDPKTVRRHVRMVRRHFETPWMFLPGIGALGGKIDEAFGAAEGCRRYAIIGRAILRARRPQTMARRFADEALKYA